jgi:hypothetical protein
LNFCVGADSVSARVNCTPPMLDTDIYTLTLEKLAESPIRTRLGGRMFEARLHGYAYRGPIQNLAVGNDGRMLVVRLSRIESQVPRSNRWKLLFDRHSDIRIAGREIATITVEPNGSIIMANRADRPSRPRRFTVYGPKIKHATQKT